MTKLTLPSMAGALWRDTRNSVREGVAEITGNPEAYTIGGGTILAARWRHRQSQDIDLVIDEAAHPGSVLARPGSAFKEQI